MKKIILIFFSLIGLLAYSAGSEELSREKQQEIVENYLYFTGQWDHTSLLSSGEEEPSRQHLPVKCGTPAVVEFLLDRDKIDKDLLKALGAQLEPRPTNLTQSIVSPSGKFLIHYNVTGNDAVYAGIPGYVDSVAAILDEVYTYLIDTLGYPPPPTDEFYPAGGDEKYDVYIVNLGGSAFGLTFLDSVSFDVNEPLKATSFIEVDNDYQEIFSYKDRPLDAVRVTCAHELFHAVHFGIDFTEIQNLYWLEMSSTWMEEEQYDAINDYYNYLPFFFDSPWASIQQFKDVRDFHPYASMLYLLYLSEKHNRDLIREIWLRCGSMGAGPHFLLAADQVIDSISSGAESFASSFAEFALWNYFTGSRANLAPPVIGYSERQFYIEEFSDDPDTGLMAVHGAYPILVLGNQNPFNPDHNAAFYLRFEELRTVQYDTSFWNCYSYTNKEDTTYWICNDGAFPFCNDSTEVIFPFLGYDTLYIDTIDTIVICVDSGEVTDTSLGYDLIHVDSVFTFGLAHDPDFNNFWGLAIVYHAVVNNQDSVIVDELFLPPGGLQGIFLDFIDPRQYRSITMIFTPASADRSLYKPADPNGDYYVAYLVREKGQIDSTLINVPLAMFAPYPNPVVVSEMDEPKVMFKFQVPTDSTSFPIFDDPYLLVDIFNVAGEYIHTLDEITLADSRDGEYWTEWDLKNARGKKVASGVYIAYARFYSAEVKGELLAQVKTKIAVIR